MRLVPFELAARPTHECKSEAYTFLYVRDLNSGVGCLESWSVNGICHRKAIYLMLPSGGIFLHYFEKKKERNQLFLVAYWSAVGSVGVLFVLII